MRNVLMAAVCFVAAAALAVIDRPVVTYYVSPNGDDAANGSSLHPVKTLERAVELTRSVMSDAKREIVVADGFYVFEKTLELGADDVDLTIRAAHPGKAILSGAVPVTGWQQDEDDSRFLTARLPFVPQDEVLHSFVVGDETAEFSSYPEFMGGNNIRCPATLGDGTNFNILPYAQESFPEGFDIAGIDLASAWVIVPQEWDSTRSYIATNDVENKCFILKSKTGMPIGKFNCGFKLMNTRIGLRHPGMWMFEQTKGRVVYWPKEGESPDDLRCTISRLQCLIALSGVRNATIEGFLFEGCNVPFVNSVYGKNPYLSGMVSARNCTRLKVSRCEFRNASCGGVYLVKADRAEVSDCHVHHVGSDGISFIDGGEGHCKILRNHVHHNGQIDPTSTSINMQISPVECIGNKVHDAPGSGMVLWGSFCVVASNDISNVMSVRRDGAGLYGGYDYTLVKDNYVHYTVKNGWPGLYADEGSQHTVFTGNRVEGLGWATHMHCTYGIIVSNNVFKNDGPILWTFQGSTHGAFVDNKIYTSRDFTNDAYVANCSEWARNEVFLPDGYGYRSAGTRTFTVNPAPVPEPIVVPCAVVKDGKSVAPVLDGKWQGEYMIRWVKVRGFHFLGNGMPELSAEPANYLRQCYDGDYLYLHFSQIYPKLTPYAGVWNLNHVWGKGDAIRVYLGEKLEITAYFDGTVESNDPEFNIGKDDFALDVGGWWSGKGIELRIPCALLGIARGKTIAFNAQCYNGDHDMYRWMFPPRDGNVRTGALVFPAEDVMEVK